VFVKKVVASAWTAIAKKTILAAKLFSALFDFHKIYNTTPTQGGQFENPNIEIRNWCFDFRIDLKLGCGQAPHCYWQLRI